MDTSSGMSAHRLLARLARHPLMSLAALCLCLWLPTIFALPPLDRDESRFAQSSKQMLESGDFVDIRFGEVPRYKKPVGIYWLQAATTEVAGFGAHDRIWTYRLASLLGGIASVWLTFWCARAFASQEAALLAAGLLASTLLLSAEASIATTDAVLLACTMGAQGALLRTYLGERGAGKTVQRSVVLAGWAALGVGILVKGPVAPAVSVVTAAALSLWDRDVRWLARLRPLWGLAIIALIVAPWAIAIALESHGQFFQQSLGNDFVAKLAAGQETHGAPPGYYLALVTFTFWPATIFLLPGLREAVARREDRAVRFLLAWAGASWVMFELVPTKLPHYILPAYPALAVLAALWVDRAGPDFLGLRGWRVAAAAQFALGLVVLLIATFVLPFRYGDGVDPIGAILSLISFGMGAVAGVLFLRGQLARAGATVIASALALHVALAIDASRHLERLWISPRLASLVAGERLAGDPPEVAAGFAEPSLVFMLGTGTRLTDGSHAAELASQSGGLALIEDSDRAAFLKRLSLLGSSASPRGSVSGLNYSRGRGVEVTVYRVLRPRIAPGR
jgi:4-amino-4-deoxy-L-arabinose transferase-like glycosyltransferase